MSKPTLVYRHAEQPGRGLATAGIFLIKALMALPHLIIVGVLQNLAWAVGYVGYWIVAFTGKMPTGIFQLIEISMRWSARSYGWLIGYTDAYPPFEIAPEYPVDVQVTAPENPSKGWAVAGLLFVPKGLAALPHLFVLAFLDVAAVFAVWFGYIATAFTGSFPVGIQDFVAGVLGYNYRLWGWVLGLYDEYPEFTLKATLA
ncbi:MAG: hypothetical protein A2Z12_07655 [Actinobacteria bacterium RBG_16_68_21]|nr:MAG: hypothetical protein A2Z12_07655 [Actinobacteria bacterium RBG_16_68_21]